MEIKLLDDSLMALYDYKKSLVPDSLITKVLAKGFYDREQIDPIRLLERIYEIGFANKVKNVSASMGANRDMFLYDISIKGIHFIENLPTLFKNKPYSYFLKLETDGNTKKEEIDILQAKQTQSIIDTNKSVQRTNFWMPILTAAIVLVSLIGLLRDIIKDRRSDTSIPIQQFQTRVQLLDSTLKTHIEKDSAFQSQVKDSLNIAR